MFMEPNNNTNENNINPNLAPEQGLNPNPNANPNGAVEQTANAAMPVMQPTNPEPVMQSVSSEPVTQSANPEPMAQPVNPEPMVSESIAQPANSAEAKKPNRLRLILVIVLILMLIAGGIVTAIVLINNNTNSGNTDNRPTSSDEEAEQETEDVDEAAMEVAVSDYTELSNDLTNKIMDEDITDINTVLALYKEKIDSLDNKLTQAMLTLDYLQILMSTQIDDTTRDMIIEDAIAADATIGTSSSATIVAKIAASLGDADLAEQYNQFANERGETF